MGQSIGIFYFSGTGNTEIAVELLRREFVNQGCTADIFRIEDLLKNAPLPDLPRYDILGIGHPVIGFGAPGIIRRFIKILPPGNGRRVFLLKTAGGVGPINYSASRPEIRQLTRKGYDVFYDRIMSLGSNWVVKFDDRVIRRLYQAMRRKAGIMCAELLAGKRRALNAGFPLTLIMEVVNAFDRMFMRFLGYDLRASNDCNRCGTCIRICPVGNIFENNEKIRWKLKCNCCMRCVYSCPRHAIHYRIFSFFELQGGLNVRTAIDGPDTAASLDGVRKPPFLDGYAENDDL